MLLVFYLLHLDVTIVYIVLASKVAVYQNIIFLAAVGAFILVSILFLLILLAERGLVRASVAREPTHVRALLPLRLLHVGL